MAQKQGTETNVGPNEWLVDEMYEQAVADAGSVSESWREFFADYKRDAAPPPPQPAPPPDATPDPAEAAPTTAAPATAAPATPKPSAPAVTAAAANGTANGSPIRGAGARIAENMEASLAVP